MGECFSTTLPRYQGQRVFIQPDRKLQERHQRSVDTSIPNPRDVQTSNDCDYTGGPEARSGAELGHDRRSATTIHSHLGVITSNESCPYLRTKTIGAAINNIDGNKLRTTEWTQRNLDTTRQQHWISTNNKSCFSNPTQAVHTLLNWFKANVTERDVKAIKYIESLNQPTELAEAI